LREAIFETVAEIGTVYRRIFQVLLEKFTELPRAQNGFSALRLFADPVRHLLRARNLKAVNDQHRPEKRQLQQYGGHHLGLGVCSGEGATEVGHNTRAKNTRITNNK